jgi:hypothetical protein
LCGDILPVAILPTPADGCHEPRPGFMVIRLRTGGKNAWFRKGLCSFCRIAAIEGSYGPLRNIQFYSGDARTYL